MFALRLAALAAALCLPGLAVAQATPPAEMKVVVPSTPGAGQDTMGRFLAEALTKHWSNTVIVENVPGAGGAIGAAAVAQANPDGATMLIAANSYNTNAAVATNLPFDPEKDLIPVAMVARSTLLLVTGSRVPIASLEDLQREAKAQKIFYGSSGRAALPAFASELLATTLGIDLEPVIYKGAADALIDVAGGRLDLYIATLTTLMPVVEKGDAKALAVLSDTRNPALPDVPTVGELGYAQAKTDVWYGVWVPKGTPPEVIAMLNEGINAVTNSAEGTAFLAGSGSTPGDLDPQQIAELVTGEIAQWKAIAQANGITAQ